MMEKFKYMKYILDIAFDNIEYNILMIQIELIYMLFLKKVKMNFPFHYEKSQNNFHFIFNAYYVFKDTSFISYVLNKRLII